MDTESKTPMETKKDDCQHFLPAEVLTYIFGLLDPRTLVLNCRLVCKFWKETVESSNVWRLQIDRNAKSNDAVASVLPNAHNVCPWYMCYALTKNIFGKNLFPKVMPEGRPRYWAVDEYHNSGGMIYSSPISSFLLGFSPIPQELLDEGISSCLLASIGECSVNHSIDLYECGFTKKIMESNPPIHISEWFAVRNNFIGTYYLEVTLFNSEWAADNENGQFQYRFRTERLDWHFVTHTFTNYRSDVRYIMFHHGVDIFFPSTYMRYREVEARDPGSKMAAAKVIINLPDLSESTTSE